MAQEERRVCMTTEDGTQVWIPESKVEAWKQADHNAPLTPEEKEAVRRIVEQIYGPSASTTGSPDSEG